MGIKRLNLLYPRAHRSWVMTIVTLKDGESQLYVSYTSSVV